MGTLALVVQQAVPAAALPPGLTADSPDSSGYYAHCNLDLTELSTSDNDWGSSLPSDVQPYIHRYGGSIYCNSAFVNAYADSNYGYTISNTSWIGGANRGDPGLNNTGSYASGYANDGVYHADFGIGSSASNGFLACFDAAAFTLSDFPSADYGSGTSCSSGVTCGVFGEDPTTSHYYGNQSSEVPCKVDSVTYDDSLTEADEPSTYWGSQTPVIPAPGTPVVTCSAAVDSAHDSVELTGTATAVPGATLSYQWDYGDSSGYGTALTEQHTYSSAANETAILTVTATGDGVDAAGTTTAQCQQNIDFITGSAGAGPSATNPPTSCGWTDVLCEIEKAIAYLFVPGPGFYTTWSSFLSTMEQKVPFAYVTAAAQWASTFAGTLDGDTGQGACLNVLPAGDGFGDSSTCQTGPSALATAVQVIVGGGFIALLAVTVWAAARRVLADH